GARGGVRFCPRCGHPMMIGIEKMGSEGSRTPNVHPGGRSFVDGGRPFVCATALAPAAGRELEASNRALASALLGIRRNQSRNERSFIIATTRSPVAARPRKTTGQIGRGP